MKDPESNQLRSSQELLLMILMLPKTTGKVLMKLRFRGIKSHGMKFWSLETDRKCSLTAQSACTTRAERKSSTEGRGNRLIN